MAPATPSRQALPEEATPRRRALLDALARGEVKRLLLVRLARLGDLLFTTPALRVVNQAFPDIPIDYLTTAYASGIVAHNPRVDRVLLLDRKWHRPGFWRRRRRTLREIAAGGYGAAVIFESKGSTRRMLETLLRRAGIPHIVSRELFEGPILGGPPRHTVERHLALVSMLGVAPDGQPCESWCSDQDSAHAESLLREAGARPDEPRIGLQMGCHYSMWPEWIFWNQRYKYHKTWPVDRFAELARRLAGGLGARVVLTGSGQERILAARVAQAASPPAVNLVGRTTVGQLTAVVAATDLFISVDTGSMHMAASLGVPLVALFGPTDPAHHGPYGAGDRAVVLRSGIPCSPCSKPVRKRCPANECMLRLPVDQVERAALDLWESQGRVRHRERLDRVTRVE